MRVPNVLQGRGALSSLDRIRTELDRAGREIASGKRVGRPSDDPLATARASEIASRLLAIETYRSHTDRAEAELVTVDLVIDDLEKLMDAAASAAASGRSGTATTERFQALATEVDGLRDEVLRLGNTRFGGTYLFAGRQSLTQAFTESAGVVTYQGDTVAPTVRIGDGAVVETSIPGSTLFQGAGDVFRVLADLRDALLAEDTQAVATEAQNVEGIARGLSQLRARVGSTLQELGRHRVRLNAVSVEEQASLSQEVDADLVEAIGRLAAQKTSLEAALGAGARLLSVTLMDVLG